MIPLVAPKYSKADRVHFGGAYDDDTLVVEFEEEFAAYVGCRGGVAVNSGTSALMVALRALGAWDVALPSYTCRALYDAWDAVCWSEGRRPTLVDNVCDVPGANFSMGWARFGPTVIVPHMFGTQAVDMVGIEQTAIHDITLSLGAVRSPQYGVCSFYRDKMISTGRGGMIVSNDQSFLDKCRMLTHYETSMNGFHYLPAFSFGMTGMQAALGRSQLRQLPGFIERRKEIAARYTAAFRGVGIETPDPAVDSVFFRYIIGVDDPAAAVVELARLGVEAGRGVNPPLHRLLGLDPESFPGAEECWSRLLSVPVHPGLTDEQVGYITEQVVQTCAP